MRKTGFILGMVLLILAMTTTLSSCQKTEDKEAATTTASTETTQGESKNQGLDMEVVADMVNKNNFADPKYGQQCKIQKVDGSYKVDLFTNGNGSGTRELSSDIWSDYDCNVTAHCQTIVVDEKQYLVIYGEEYNVDKNLEVVEY